MTYYSYPLGHLLLSFNFIGIIVVVQQRRLETASAGLAEARPRGQAGGGRGNDARAPGLALAGVRRQVRAVEELREQHEIAKVHCDRQLDVHRRDVARAARRLDEGVRPNVDGTADNHLGQLQRRDEHRDKAGRIEAHRSQGVVRVHQRVDTVVHHDEPARRGRVFRVAEPGVHQHRDVVVPVQEDQRLLAQHNEDRVAQLGQLGEHEQPCPEARHFVLLNKTGGWTRGRKVQ